MLVVVNLFELFELEKRVELIEVVLFEENVVVEPSGESKAPASIESELSSLTGDFVLAEEVVKKLAEELEILLKGVVLLTLDSTVVLVVIEDGSFV